VPRCEDLTGDQLRNGYVVKCNYQLAKTLNMLVLVLPLFHICYGNNVFPRALYYFETYILTFLSESVFVAFVLNNGRCSICYKLSNDCIGTHVPLSKYVIPEDQKMAAYL
jgi:hypothetical protein